MLEIREKFHKIIYSHDLKKHLVVKCLSSYSRKEIGEEGIKQEMLSNCMTLIGTLFDKLFEGKYEFYNFVK
jgi:hypothetical protein